MPAPPTRWVRDPSWSRTFALAAVVWVVIGATWALTSPPYSVPDEPAHVVRAASVAGGQLLGTPEVVELPGPPPVRMVEHAVTVPAPLAEADTSALCFIFARGPADCADPLPDVPGVAVAATTAGAYQPVFYAAVGWPFQVMGADAALITARMVHALLGALLLAAATATAWDLGGRLHVAVLVLGITPVTPYLLGSVNPNGLEVAAAVALWAAALALVLRAQVRYAVIAAVAMAVLAWTRPLSPLIAVGILVAVLAAAASPNRVRALRRRSIVAIVAAGLTAVIAAIGWVRTAGALDAFVGTPDPAATGWVAIRSSASRTVNRLVEMVGHLGWLDTPLPTWLPVAWGLVVVAVLALALRHGWWRDRLVLAALVLGTLLLPIAAELQRAADLGYFWQGRYSLPVAVGIVVVAGWVLSRSDRVAPRPARALVVACAAVAAGGHAVAQMEAMARYSTGPGTSAVAWLWRDGWQAPVPDPVVGLLVGLGAVGLAALVLAADQPARPRM